MYIPKLFQNNNIDEVREFIRQNGFAILINQSEGRICATHIPLLLDINENGKEILHGHIAKANPQWQNFSDGAEVMVIFQGPHAYISSSWYGHENVPTWNYLAVHIYGLIKIYDEAMLIKSLTKLVDKYETTSVKPVSMHTMSAEMLKDNLKAVVGFEIEISKIYSAKKLSQNRDDKDYNNIINELEKASEPNAIQIAKEMHKNRNIK